MGDETRKLQQPESEQSHNTAPDARWSSSNHLLRLPVELRTIIYDHVFAHQMTFLDMCRRLQCDIERYQLKAFTPHKHWIALIYTCRQISQEALPYAYRHARFYPSVYPHWETPEKTEHFLNTIGPNNARNITWVHLEFPYMTFVFERELEGPFEYMTFDTDDLKIFNLIREACPALTTLSLSFDFEVQWDEYDTSFELSDAVRVALRQMEHELRKFPSLSNVYIWWEGRCTGYMLDEVSDLGWHIDGAATDSDSEPADSSSGSDSDTTDSSRYLRTVLFSDREDRIIVFHKVLSSED